MENFAKLSKIENIWKSIAATHADMLFPVLILMFHANKLKRPFNNLNTKNSFFVFISMFLRFK